MLRRLASLALAALVCGLTLPAVAQTTAAVADMESAPVVEGVRAELLEAWQDTGDKFAALAEAGAEAYAWRPDEGVRSVNEVLLHVAGANYMLASMLDTAPPEGFSRETYETHTSDPAAVEEAVRHSFAHFRGAVVGMDETGMDETVQWFGGAEKSKRFVVIFAEKHASEHLGQLIAYMRMNGMTPPWSE